MSVLLAAGVACIASASAFAPACLGPSTRSVARSGVTDLSMSAGTGKIKTVAAFRAGLECLVSLAACLSSVSLSIYVRVVGSLTVTIQQSDLLALGTMRPNVVRLTRYHN